MARAALALLALLGLGACAPCPSVESVKWGFRIESCTWPGRLGDWNHDTHKLVSAFDHVVWAAGWPWLSDYLAGYVISIEERTDEPHSAWYEEWPRLRVVLRPRGDSEALRWLGHEFWHLYEFHEFGLSFVEWNALDRHFLLGDYAQEAIDRAEARSGLR